MGARIMSRVAVLAAVGGITLASPAAPAYAHVEVSADKPQAGATDVTLTFVGEAESDSAGITSERIVLPDGISPTDVTLAKAPGGWRMTVDPDGVTIAGKALAAGKDATVAIKVAKLPADETRLSFKTIETYGDGTVARWIEIRKEGADEPDNPAPLLKLKAAAVAPSAAPSSAPVQVGTSATAVQAVAASTGEDGGISLRGWASLAGLVVVAVAGFLLGRRRQQRRTS
jgi:uncharacterized protein YcnI